MGETRRWAENQRNLSAPVDAKEINFMNDNKLQKMEGGALAARAPVDIEALFRTVVEKGADVGTMERLMQMRKELTAEAAKAAFDSAMADFQQVCPPIVKSKGVPDRNGNTAYKYSPFEDILRIVRPVMRAHGFSFTLDTDTDSAPGWVVALCKITHQQGHSELSRAKFPLGTKTGIMSDTQVYASALTFASRRVFCNALGLVTSSEDRDGTADAPKPRNETTAPTAEEIADKRKLVDLLRTVHRAKGYGLDAAALKAIEQWLHDETVIPDDVTLAGLRGAALAAAVAKTESRLRGAR